MVPGRGRRVCSRRAGRDPVPLPRRNLVSVRVEAFGLSHVGKVRKRNEDTLCVEPARGILIVADGMGGAPAGDVASAMGVQEVARGLHAGLGMRDSVDKANLKILEMARAQPAFEGMGTTVTALRISPETGKFVVGHVGDSRAYHRRDGELVQITTDHTLVREMVEAGKIPPELERNHPFGHILSRALGTEDQAEVDILRGAAKLGDAFLLCTDGLMKVMDDEEIQEWIMGMGPGSLEEVVGAMVEVGMERGAPDNITLAAMVLRGVPEGS